MNKKLLLLLALGLFCCSNIYAQEATNSDSERAPWLKGAENTPVRPVIPAPVMDMSIGDENGNPLPNEVTEDIPFTVTANSDIYFDEAPTKSITSNYEFLQAEWVDQAPITLWFIDDWSKKSSSLASTSANLAINQKIIIPTTPTDRGSLTCHSSRKMKYYTEEGKKVLCFANSTCAKLFKVKDITPPTCGLEISINNGNTGRLWPVENPPDHYPLPKTADMCFSGSLFNDDPEEVRVSQGYELGDKMIVSGSDAAIKLKKTDVIKVKVIGDDNFKLNNQKLKYGVCAGAGGEPTPVSPVNVAEIDFSKFAIPENPYLYLDAYDMAGNREILYIQLDIE